MVERRRATGRHAVSACRHRTRAGGRVIHGSGNMGRGSERGNEILRAHARHLAARGTAVLLYDKRGVGESSGNWRGAGFDLLAGDAATGVAALRTHPRVDPDRIGLIGLSQGAWISVMIARADPRIAFLAWVTGAAVTPARQEEHVVAARMRSQGASEADLAEAMTILRQAFTTYRTDTGWEALAAGVEAASTKPWFKGAQLAVATRAEDWWRWYASFMDYDPVSDLERLQVPLLAAFGSEDQLINSTESLAVLEGLAGRRPDITARIYPGARHGFRYRSGALTVPAAYWTAGRFLSASSVISVRLNRQDRRRRGIARHVSAKQPMPR